MAGGQYRYLFSPLKLGPVTVGNRIVFAAHLTNYAEGGMPTQQHADYYAARAAGGAGLIITEEHSVHPTDWPYEKMIHAFHPEVVPGYRRITDAVHAHGTPIFAQINHNGGQASSMYTRLPVWAPSAVADPLFREVPKAVDHLEIAEIVAGYAEVAARCKEGGFDGIELQCSHSSIVRGFLSRATNTRTDEYGGSLANRSRFAIELIQATRAAVGPNFPIIFRFSQWKQQDYTARLVQTPEALGEFLKPLADAGVDIFHCSTRRFWEPEFEGSDLNLAGWTRQLTGKPTITVGSVGLDGEFLQFMVNTDKVAQPASLEKLLERLNNDEFDLVAVGRALLVDPDWAVKVREGREGDILPFSREALTTLV